MTNGEKLQETFPKTIFIQERTQEGILKALVCSQEWWDMDYKEQEEAAADEPN